MKSIRFLLAIVVIGLFAYTAGAVEINSATKTPASAAIKSSASPLQQQTKRTMPDPNSAVEKPASASNGQKYLLKSSRTADSMDKIAYQIDIQGNLSIPSEKEKGKMEKFPVKAATKLAYTERTISCTKENKTFTVESIRNYQQVKTDRTVNDEMTTLTLQPQKNILEVASNGADCIIFHKEYSMLQNELDTLEVMADSNCLDSLLPEEAVAVDDEWSIPEEALAALLQLDALNQAQVAQILTEIKGTTAIIDAQGWAEGMADGVKTVLSFKLKYYFSMKARRIIWVGMVTNEERQPGPISPSLAVESRVSMTIAPGASNAALTAEKWVEPTEELMLIHYISPDGTWSMFHNRGWHAVQETENQTVFRYLYEGSYIAQCVINKPINPQQTKNMTLAAFTKEVETAIKQENSDTRSVVSSNEETSPTGVMTYQIIAEDKNDGSQWVYYMLKGAKDEQLVFMFMLDKANAEKIGITDMQMVGTLSFTAK